MISYMKKLIIAAAVLSALSLCGCTSDSNAVSQGSEYVSAESSEMESIGEMREDQIAEAEAAIQDIQ